MNILNKVGYNPFADILLNAEGTLRAHPRPPRDPAAVCDYFAMLGYIEDEGAFSHREMADLITNPDSFFSKSHAGA